MSYHIYRTEGFVLGSNNTGEANKNFLVYTKDIGLIYARAQGVRFLKSKLRHVLQDFSFCNVSLVRGREVWRLTNVSEINNPTHQSDWCVGKPLSRESLVVFAKVALVLKRFLHGEEKNEKLWNALVSGYEILSKGNLNDNNLKAVEIILVLQSLSALGYISLPKDMDKLAKEPLSSELIGFLKGRERTVLQEINRALKESQL